MQRQIECQSEANHLQNSIASPKNMTMNSKEMESLRFQLGQQRIATEEALNERQNLMELAQNYEAQAKENHRNMEKALNRVGGLENELAEKIAQLDDIHLRLTKVASLFERKEIKQKYTFEVLSDFIYDKAKRLFSKYEVATKERKQGD